MFRLNQPMETLPYVLPVEKNGGDTLIANEAIIIEDVCVTSRGSESQEATRTLQDDQDVSQNPYRPWVIFYSKLCVVLGLIEVPLGSFVYDAFSNQDNYANYAGAWWSGLIVFASGVLGYYASTKRRVRLTIFVSMLGHLTTLGGGMLDALAAGQARSMTACGYEYSAPFKNRYFVGNPIDYKNVTLCMDKRDRDGYQLDGTCICTDHEDGNCRVYALSASSLKNGLDCSAVYTSYRDVAVASTVVCFATWLIILSHTICCIKNFGIK